MSSSSGFTEGGHKKTAKKKHDDTINNIEALLEKSPSERTIREKNLILEFLTKWVTFFKNL